MRTRIRIAAVALAVLLPAAAQATVVRALSLEDLTRKAEVVAVGRVVQVHTVQRGGLVFTEAEVLVSSGLKGARADDALVVRTLGGSAGGLEAVVAGSPRWREGEEVVLFGQQRGGALAPVGMAQGVYRLQRDPGGVALAVRDLRGLTLVQPRGPAPAAPPPVALPLERQPLQDLLAEVRRHLAREVRP